MWKAGPRKISFITTSTLRMMFLKLFYEDCLEYKGYVNDILNTLIRKDDILHRIEKENTTEHCKRIKSLQN